VQQFQETNGTLKTDVHDIVANDEHAVALATFSGQRSGKSVSDRYTHAVHIKDGKVTESWIFDENPSAIDEFWA
jgi:ketosteroid isomerase-like protein